MKTISRILILAMLHLCWLTSYGYAEMVSTESAQSQVQDDRQRILDLLDRQEVIGELEKYGISKVEAVARINSLTDEEVTEIAGRLDELTVGKALPKDPLSMGLMVLYWGFVIALALVIYIPGVMAKGVICMSSDCEEKGGTSWVFTPWWGWNDEDKIKRTQKSEELKPVDQKGCLTSCNSQHQTCVNTFLSDIQVYQRPNQEFIVPKCKKGMHICRQKCLIEMNNNYPWK
jgi:Family of unknown function (DUF6627)